MVVMSFFGKYGRHKLGARYLIVPICMWATIIIQDIYWWAYLEGTSWNLPFTDLLINIQRSNLYC